MREGFDGLAALVSEQMGHDPADGALYLFVSRNRIRAKVRVWDGTGLCLYAKRLEEGRFATLWGREDGGKVKLSMSELAKTTAILYSLIETAKLCGQNPAEYLRAAAYAAIRCLGTVTLPL